MIMPISWTSLILFLTKSLRISAFSARSLSISFSLSPVYMLSVSYNIFGGFFFISISFCTSSCMITVGSPVGWTSAICNVLLLPVLLFLFWTRRMESAEITCLGISMGGLVNRSIVSFALFAWMVAYTE